MNNVSLAGAIGAVGLVFQIILGEELASSGNLSSTGLILPHMLIGVAGIALVAFLVANIFLVASPMLPRLVYALAFVLTLAQVALGFRLLSSPDNMLLMAHQGIAVVILILLAIGGMIAARSRRKMMGQTAPAPV